MCLGAALAAQANNTPVEVPANGVAPLGTLLDMPLHGTGTGGGNGASAGDDFTRLDTVITLWNGLNPTDKLPVPVLTGDDTVSGDPSKSITLSGYDYAVVHYGVGNGGMAGTGGGLEIFYLDGAASWTFPQNGTGPNGEGGISGVVLFEGDGVPDGGTAVLMLGAVLTGLGSLGRKAGG